MTAPKHVAVVQAASKRPSPGEALARFLARRGKPIYMIYAVLGLLPLFMFRTEFNAPYLFAFRYLALPIVIVILAFALHYRAVFQARCKSVRQFWTGLVCLVLLAVLFSGGYVSFANAILPNRPDELIQGKVVRKEVIGGRLRTPVLLIADGPTQIRLEVSRREFDAIQVGETYRKKWHVGACGFRYLWRGE